MKRFLKILPALLLVVLLCLALLAQNATITQLTGTLSSSETSVQGSSVSQIKDLLTEKIEQATLSKLPKEDGIDESKEGQEYEAGRVLVSFSSPAYECSDVMTSKANLKSEASSILLRAKSLDAEKVTRLDNSTALVKVKDGASVSQAIKELEGLSGIEDAQPDYIYTLADTKEMEGSEVDTSATSAAIYPYTATDDPLTEDNQWTMYLPWENVVSAWDVQKCDNKVTVAILDTGIDEDHEDLKENIVESVGTVVNEDTQEYIDKTGQDIDTHGTHCAGIVSAQSNNGIGITGVSYNANLLAVKVFHGEYVDYGDGDYQWSTTANSSSIARGIRYAISKKDDYNVRVISMSLGTSNTSIDNPPLFERVVTSAIDEAWDAGVSVIAASGNDSENNKLTPVSFPAYYEKCVAVGACKADGSRLEQSNGSAELDVVAPGNSIFSTIPYDANSTLATSDYTYRYANKKGTSMATPYVSAVAALCYAKNPELQPQDILSILTSTAGDADGKFSNELGYGKVNPYLAVKAASGEEEEKCQHDGETTTTVTKQATCSATGLSVTKCAKCGEILSTQILDKLAHTPIEKANSAVEPTCTQAGKKADT